MIINQTEYVTIREAAEMLNKHYLTVRSMVLNGMLPSTKFSPRKVFIRKEDVTNLMK